MGILHVSARVLAGTMPVILIVMGVLGVLLIVVGCVYRWNAIAHVFGNFLLRRSQYDYRRIFINYLERFNLIKNHQDLYPAILSAACRAVSATGASLLVRNEAGQFEMCASYCLSAFSVDMSEVRNFLAWLESKQAIVTRAQLVESKSFSEIKSEGLRYFVQFNAEACVPLFWGDKLHSILNVGCRKKGGYDRETRDLLHLLAAHFTAAIRNAELNRTLARQNRELTQAVQFRNRLLSNLSHELRTPLNSVIGLSEVLRDGADGALNEEQKNHISMVNLAGRRLLNAVNAMMDLSKIEANHLELNVQKVNLRRLLGDVAGSIPFNRDTELKMDITEETPSVYGDEPWLKQVFWHLLDNAAKFTKRGEVCVNASKCGEMLKVRVADTGIGIPPDKQGAIMQGFYQVDGGTNREYEGLGMGLAISKKIVELHGGRLWCASKLGRGSDFYLTLPLKPIGLAHPEIKNQTEVF